jgi:hypothetical protein
MSRDNKEIKAPSENSNTGADNTKALIDHIGSSGALKPLARILNGLLESSLLRQTLDKAPTPGSSKNANDNDDVKH